MNCLKCERTTTPFDLAEIFGTRRVENVIMQSFICGRHTALYITFLCFARQKLTGWCACAEFNHVIGSGPQLIPNVVGAPTEINSF